MPKLYVVATPIGNLMDLTPRMHEALAEADLIAAEDTRVTMKLTAHLGLSKKMISHHQHNEATRVPELIRRMLAEDLTVALTCDAGTPAISDPGTALVDAAWAAGIPVVPICGPSAVVCALSAAGFDARAFAFYGFLPRERGKLRDKLLAIQATGIPVAVAYESPHRVLRLVEEIAKTFPAARLAVCCDLSKRFELILRGPCQEVLDSMRQNPKLEKGEYCLVMDLLDVPPPAVQEQPAMNAEALLMAGLLDGRTLSAVAEEALTLGYARNDVYRAKVRVKDFLAAQRGADDLPQGRDHDG